ncbi:hypothetical protein PC114_g8343 [Phytophthora cactorum]|nr:hypothetical protein PC114_g8343 [Phytophthora cactorum]
MELWKLAQFAILRQYPVNRHQTLASPLPSHRTQQPSRCSFVHTLYLRPGCVWLHPGKPLWWTATSVFPGGTNNEMEASALLAGLQWIREHHPQQAVLIVGDSAIVAAMAAATMRVRAPNLAPLIRDIHHIINQLGHIGIRSVPRAFNVAADSLSNGIMDQDATRSLHKSVADTDCPLQELQWSDPFTCRCPPIYWVPEPVYDRIAVQLATKRSGHTGTPMTTELKADLLLWKELVFENQFAGVPMTMFGTAPPELDGWVIVHSNNSSQITAYGLTPRRAQQFFIEKTVRESDIA